MSPETQNNRCFEHVEPEHPAESAATDETFALIVRFNGKTIERLNLDTELLTVGGPSADLSYPAGPFIDERHCHFHRSGAVVEVVDGWPDTIERSRYGIHVNGIRIDRFEVEPGDVISIGDPNDPLQHLEVTVVTSTDSNLADSTDRRQADHSPGETLDGDWIQHDFEVIGDWTTWAYLAACLVFLRWFSVLTFDWTIMIPATGILLAIALWRFRVRR